MLSGEMQVRLEAIKVQPAGQGGLKMNVEIWVQHVSGVRSCFMPSNMNAAPFIKTVT